MAGTFECPECNARIIAEGGDVGTVVCGGQTGHDYTRMRRVD